MASGCLRELHGTLPKRSSPCLDWFVRQESIEIFSQSERVGIALSRLSFNTFQTDRFQIERKLRAETRGRNRVFLADELERFGLCWRP